MIRTTNIKIFIFKSSSTRFILKFYFIFEKNVLNMVTTMGASIVFKFITNSSSMPGHARFHVRVDQLMINENELVATTFDELSA